MMIIFNTREDTKHMYIVTCKADGFVDIRYRLATTVLNYKYVSIPKP